MNEENIEQSNKELKDKNKENTFDSEAFRLDTLEFDNNVKSVNSNSLWFLTITSAVVLFGVIYNGLWETIGVFLAALVSVICCWVYVGNVEGRLKVVAPAFFRVWLKYWKFSSSFSVWMYMLSSLFLLVLLLAATGLLTYNFSGNISELLFEEPDKSALSDISAKNQSKFLKLDSIYSLDIKKAEAAIVSAQKSGAGKMAVAIESKGANMAKLYRSGGNDWVKEYQNLGRALKKAKKDSLNLVLAAKSALIDLQEDKRKAMSIAIQNDSTATTIASGAFKGELERINTYRANARLAFTFIVFVCLFAFLFTTILIVVREKITGILYQPEMSFLAVLNWNIQNKLLEWKRGLVPDSTKLSKMDKVGILDNEVLASKLNGQKSERTLLAKGLSSNKKSPKTKSPKSKKSKKPKILEGVAYAIHNGQKLTKKECQNRRSVYIGLAKKAGENVSDNTLEKIKYWNTKIEEVEEMKRKTIS